MNPSGIKAGRAFVIIDAVDKTGRVLGNIRHRVGQFAAQISAMGQGLALRAAAALTPVGMSMNTFKQFDDSLRKVEARSRGTAGEMQDLRNQAKELGRTTAFTASHIGELQAKLAQFGMSRANILAATKPIMLLARAGGTGTDLGTDIMQSADAVRQVLAAFQMEVSDTAMVADLLSTTVNNSSFSLEELRTALQHGAPTAATFNVGLKEMIALMAAMRDLGYDSSIVGTALRNIELRMSRASGQEKFNKRLQELTGQTIEFTDAAKNLKSPLEILMQFHNVLSGIGNSETATMVAQLMELRATGPALGLMRAKERLAQLLTEFDNIEGAAQRTHDQMEGGIGGTFRELESAIEGVQISIGEALSKMVVGSKNATAEFLQNVSKWVEANAGYVALIVVLIGAIGLFGIGLILVGQIVMATTAIFGVASVILGGFATLLTGILTLSPAGLIAIGAALLAVAAALGIYLTFGDKITELLGTLKGQAIETVSTVANALKNGNIEAAWNVVLASMTLAFMKFVDKIETMWEDFLILSTSLVPFNLQDLSPVFSPAGRDADIVNARVKRNKMLADLEAAYAMYSQQANKQAPDTTSESKPLDSSGWQKLLDQMAANIGTAITKAEAGPGGGRIAPDIVEGLRMGTIEAARAIQQSRFDMEADDAKRTADAAESMLDVLEDIKSGVDDLAVAGGV